MTNLARLWILTLNIGKADNLAGILQLAVSQTHELLLQEVALGQEELYNIVNSGGYNATQSKGKSALGIAVLTHETLVEVQVEIPEADCQQACWISGV